MEEKEDQPKIEGISGGIEKVEIQPSADIPKPSAEASQTSSDPKPLSRHERKKLQKQEIREQQQSAEAARKRRKLIKNIITYGIIAVVIIGAYLLFKNLTKEQLPTADDDPFFGPADAKVTVIEFGDLQCPYTRAFDTEKLARLKEEYGDKVKWVFRDMPTGRHAFSREAAWAAQCANEQGKFWPYHDAIFDRFSADTESLRAYAKILELNMDQFDACFNSGKYKDEVNRDYRDGRKAGVQLTPTFFINGIKLQGDLPVHIIKQFIDQELGR